MPVPIRTPDCVTLTAVINIMQVFPTSSLLTSEYEKIREHVLAFCISPMGREQVMKIAPVNDREWIEILLLRTAEMRQVVASGLPFPASNYMDVARELSLLRIENSTLAEDQFMAISALMHTVGDLYRFFRNRKGQFQHLENILGDTVYEPVILQEIETILDETGQVKSSASPELLRIRRSLQRNRAESDRIYTTVINKYRRQGWLTESEESSRNGRRVVAIFAEQKRTIKGVIHDTSATGKTAFIEPEETIGINNAISSLEQEERLEVMRILRELASRLRKFVPVMQVYSLQLGIFDLNRAKALLAIQTEANVPRISNEPLLDLKQARHPLLFLHNKSLHKSTIPFDLVLNDENRILVISGPNAGGKTVCMKTAGLLQMMMQSGMPVCAHEDSTFGIFDHLLVDIGDSQSIEYELSTYSSRLKHMRIFLERVNEKSLFLIDEFGTGTDPNLGGALAEAVLEELNNRKAFGIITTHYLNLKVFADRTPGILNGSMEFDLKKLRPLYRLSVGKPGSSYTFLVAERSGLPRDLIRNARRKVNRKNLLLEKLLTEVESDKAQIKSAASELARKDKDLNELIKKYEVLSRESASSLSSKEQKLRKLEERMVRESEERFRNFLKEWRKAKDKKDVLEKYYRQFVKVKRKEDPLVTERKRREKLDALKSVIKPGVTVRLENGHTKGIVEQVDADRAYVIFGNVKAVCEIVNLVPVEQE